MCICDNENRKTSYCWCSEIQLSSGGVIPELQSDKGYKYYSILEANDTIHTEIKDKIQKEYYRRVRQLTSSKLNDGNTITAINSWIVSLVKYSAGILKWTKDELKVMDRKTRKIMTMNRTCNPQGDTDRLYIPRMEEGKRLLSVSDYAETEERNLSPHLDQSEERLRLSKNEKFWQNMKDLHIELRNRKKKKDTSNTA